VASESGRAQTSSDAGVVGHAGTTLGLKQKGLGRPAREGESPVGEKDQRSGMSLSTAGHANPAGSRAAHGPRLNTLDDR
jgi:hypothetical protein